MLNESDETVTIKKTEYDFLLKANHMLECLESGGVDNWEWYSESLIKGGYFEDDEF